MFDEMRSRRAARRVKSGDGHALPRFRWWPLFGRALFYLRLADGEGGHTVYAVDVRHNRTDSSGYALCAAVCADGTDAPGRRQKC